tara:strand:+ start:674 stop:1504 length:831 start_codon:yes stop_codon:yes gene_type:complete
MSKNFIEEAELIFERNYKPSLKILLEEEGDEEDTEEPLKDPDLGPAPEPESGDDSGESSSDSESKEDEPSDNANLEEKGDEDLEAENDEDLTRRAKKDRIKKLTAIEAKAGALEKKYVDKVNPVNSFMNVLPVNESLKTNNYAKGSIKRFLFEQEEDEELDNKLKDKLEDAKDILDNADDFINNLKDIDIMEFIDAYVNKGVSGYQNFDKLFDKAAIIKSAAAKVFISMSPMQAEKAIEEFNTKFEKALSNKLGIDSPEVLDNNNFKSAIGARSTG